MKPKNAQRPNARKCSDRSAEPQNFKKKSTGQTPFNSSSKRRSTADAETRVFSRRNKNNSNASLPSYEERQTRAQRYDDRHELSKSFFVCGIHPVEESLQMLTPDTLKQAKLYIANTRDDKALEQILSLSKSLEHSPIECETRVLTQKTGETRHQGVLLELPEFQYRELDDVLESLSQQPLILILDQIQDQHNLGAIIRSAAAFGADAIVIPRDRAAQITATSIRTSAGLAYRIPICRVSNLAQTLRQLKDLDFHIVGADIQGDPIENVNFHRATALIMGSENCGMRRLTRTLCDQTLRIEQNPQVESLNVSVAAAILLYVASKMRQLPWK